MKTRPHNGCTCIGIATALLLAPAAIGQGVGQVSTTYDDLKVRIQVDQVEADSPIAFLQLPEGIDPAMLPKVVDAISAGATVAHIASADANGFFKATFRMAIIGPGLDFAAYVAESNGINFLGIVTPNPREDFQAPPVPPLGPETIQVVALPGGGADVILLNGPGAEDDVVLAGGSFPLIVALKNAVPGSDPVIGVYGRITQGGNGMQIGAGDSDFKAYVAHWGSVPMRFSVVGMTPDATIQQFGVLNVMNNGTVHGGVEDARFENLTIEAKYNSCVGGPKGHVFGLLRFYNCTFRPSDANLASGAHYGFGYKWGVRIRALGRYDFRNCSFWPVLEHAIYVDSPQGDSYFVGIDHNGSTRTAIQIVNRAFDTVNTGPYELGTQVPQPPGHGRLLIEDVTIRQLTGDGGSGITVAGFLGDVWIRNITAVDNGPFQGVVVVYTEASEHHGAYFYTGLDGGLYSTRSVTIENINIDLPMADRSHVAISGVEFVRIRDFSIAGSRTAITLDSSYGAPQLNNRLCVIDGVVTRSSEHITNGRVDFFVSRPLSGYSGWLSALRLKIGTNPHLTNAQMDAMWPDL